MPQVWKISLNGDDLDAPRLVECETVGYPNKDADMDTMYDNTHFLDEITAWVKLQQEVDASVHLDASAVRKLRVQVAEVEKSLIESTLKAETVRRNRERRLGQLKDLDRPSGSDTGSGGR